MATNNHFAKFKRGRVEMIHGSVVRSFDFESGRKNVEMNSIKHAVRDLRDLVDAAAAKAEELRNSRDFTPEGKKSQFRAWAEQNLAKAAKKADAAARGAETARAGIRDLARSKLFPADGQQDVAAAVARSDIRRWVAGLSPAERTALIHAPDVDPQTALAITEVPAKMLGLTADQVEAMRERSIAASHPEFAEQIEEIDDAANSLDDHLRALTKVLESGGLAPNEIATTLGAPTLQDKIAARLDQQPEEAA